jgi:chromate transport protein ChrA
VVGTRDGRRLFIVVAAQVIVLAAYVAVLFFTEAAPDFSVEDWLFTLVPPIVFTILLAAGLVVMHSVHDRTARIAGLVGLVLTIIALAWTTLLIPIWIIGNLTDI